MHIRKLKSQDLPRFALLLKSLEEPRWSRELDEQALLENLQERLDKASQSMYFIAEEQEELVAYAAVHWIPFLLLQGPEAYVTELFVHPQSRGSGAGRALLQEIEKQARARGCHRLGLINFKDSLSYQRRFYAKSGFKEREGGRSWVKQLS